MRGSSGAKLTDHGNFVLKQDTVITGTRVRSQGIWLHQHDQSLVLPAVRYIRHDGYELEKLTMCDLPTSWKETRELCDEIIDSLETYLWDLDFNTRVPPLVPFEVTDAHRGYVTDLLDDVGLRRELRKTLHEFTKVIDWWDLRTGRTHGDGIIDNLAYRRVPNARGYGPSEREVVLIDPIPACMALPDVVSLDVGRVIQSAAGYEAARYVGVGQTQLFTVPLIERVEYVLNTWMGPGDFDLNEARAALHFSVIHMLRGLRTAQRGHHAGAVGIKGLVNDLVEVAAKWMR